MPNQFCFRSMWRKDLRDVVAIENHSQLWMDPDLEVECLRPLAWSETDFLTVIQHPDTRAAILTEGPMVIGFVMYELTQGAFTILNLKVHKDFRRVGAATHILEKLFLRLCRSKKRYKLVTVIPEYDLVSSHFFATMGFRAKLAKRFFPNHCDGIHFRRVFQPSELEVGRSEDVGKVVPKSAI